MLHIASFAEFDPGTEVSEDFGRYLRYDFKVGAESLKAANMQRAVWSEVVYQLEASDEGETLQLCKVLNIDR
jgi:hypothetical protein